MHLIVTDSTALISLDRIGRLDLLPSLFPDIIAPPAVVEEFGRKPNWLRVETVQGQKAVRTAQAQLDKGEGEAIALALEQEGSTLLIDERRGRRYAVQLGLSIISYLWCGSPC